MIKIKFIKDTEKAKKGEFGMASKKSAESYVRNGYAEYIIEEKPKTQVEKWREEAKEKEKANKITKNNKKEGFRRSISVTDVTDVTDVKSVTSVTHINNNNLNLSDVYHVYHVYQVYHSLFPVIFQNTVLDQIIKEILLAKKPLTNEELAKKVGKSEVHIRNTISRNKAYFEILKKDGKKSVTHVTHKCLEEVKQRAEEIEQIKKQQKEQELKLKVRELESQQFTLELKKFLQEQPLKREGMFLMLDFSKIMEFSPKLSDILLDEPEKFLKEVKEHYKSSLSIKLINIPNTNNYDIEELRKEHLNSIICIEGRVTSLGEVKPVITKLYFECPSCGTIIQKEQNYRVGILEEPKRCSCGRVGGFVTHKRIEENACFIQLEDLQERTDNPHSRRVKGILFNSLCEQNIIKLFTPGNEVKCSGILKEVPIFKGNKKTIFLNWIFEIIDVELIEKEIEIEKFSEEEIENINKLSERINNEGIQVLFNSFAPDVYGYDEIKSAIMFQLCNRRNNPKENSVRSKSNILMIGDPGIAKSVLGDFALKVSSGSRKAVGGGSSAVGITASVVREEDSLGGFRVEPGAMILAKDLLFIDELNNLQEEDKPKLQEGMNEQRISINKANLHVQMKVTCGIIASANPIHGNFIEDGKTSLQEQFNIPTPILNRFDSVFVMQDNINEDSDMKIAEKMINRQRGIIKPEYSVEFLKRFFAYIRHFEEPMINDNIQKILSKVYSLARRTYKTNVKINPRFLESLTRMSLSSAKLRQSKDMELQDIQNALKVLSKTQYNISESLAVEIIKF